MRRGIARWQTWWARLFVLAIPAGVVLHLPRPWDLVLIGVPLMRLLAPEYLEPYRSPFGQLLLLATSALYIGGLLLLHRLGLVKPTPRIYPRRIPKNGAVL